MKKRSDKFEEIVANIDAAEAMRNSVRHNAFDVFESHASTLAHMAMQTFGDRHRAAQWMCLRQRRLNGKSAYEALAEGDVDRVWDLMMGSDDPEQVLSTGAKVRLL
jgi:hypothetical protein